MNAWECRQISERCKYSRVEKQVLEAAKKGYYSTTIMDLKVHEIEYLRDNGFSVSRNGQLMSFAVFNVSWEDT